MGEGTLEIGSGGQLTVSGNVTNSATLRLTGNAQLNVSGVLVNTGVLDIINWNGALPAGFVNQGTVLGSSSVQVKNCSFNNHVCSLTVKGYEGHIYQLQRTSSLHPAAWTDIGSGQTGSGVDLVFSHTNLPGIGAGFYRVEVLP